MLRGGYSLILSAAFITQNSLRGKIVFNLLKCRKHSLAIICDILVVSFTGLIGDCATTTTFEDSLCGSAAD